MHGQPARSARGNFSTQPMTSSPDIAAKPFGGPLRGSFISTQSGRPRVCAGGPWAGLRRLGVAPGARRLAAAIRHSQARPGSSPANQRGTSHNLSYPIVPNRPIRRRPDQRSVAVCVFCHHRLSPYHIAQRHTGQDTLHPARPSRTDSLGRLLCWPQSVLPTGVAALSTHRRRHRRCAVAASQLHHHRPISVTICPSPTLISTPTRRVPSASLQRAQSRGRPSLEANHRLSCDTEPLQTPAVRRLAPPEQGLAVLTPRASSAFALWLARLSSSLEAASSISAH